MENELSLAASRIIDLENELTQARSVDYFKQIPSKDPVIVNLDDLIDVKTYQNQIFATCTMTILFVLILATHIESRDRTIEDLGETTVEQDSFSISAIKMGFGE